ncbi:MAG: hypothetical protein HY363_06365 [Candidatus Aenigmarchaeota archaeon]|nr:hypothetical protein [Candidatus Aenigmarchaeota archaeon]
MSKRGFIIDRVKEYDKRENLFSLGYKSHGSLNSLQKVLSGLLERMQEANAQKARKASVVTGISISQTLDYIAGWATAQRKENPGEFAVGVYDGYLDCMKFCSSKNYSEGYSLGGKLRVVKK